MAALPPEGGTILVLGAGASYGARVGVGATRPPPLRDDLAEYLLAWLSANDPERADPHTHTMMGYELDDNTPDLAVWHDRHFEELVTLLKDIRSQSRSCRPLTRVRRSSQADARHASTAPARLRR
jgi:hypothetical protein